MLARELAKLLEPLDAEAKVIFVDVATGKELEVWETWSTGMLTAFVSLNPEKTKEVRA